MLISFLLIIFKIYIPFGKEEKSCFSIAEPEYISLASVLYNSTFSEPSPPLLFIFEVNGLGATFKVVEVLFISGMERTVGTPRTHRT